MGGKKGIRGGRIGTDRGRRRKGKEWKNGSMEGRVAGKKRMEREPEKREKMRRREKVREG
jgi:hypothetical protein